MLVLLAGFSLWAAVRTNAAARQVDRDSAEQEVWQNARAELAKAESAAHAYVEHQWPGARAELSRATQGLRDGLQFIEQHADPDDVEFAQQVRTGLARYLEATRWLLAAAAAGDTARVHALEAGRWNRRLPSWLISWLHEHSAKRIRPPAADGTDPLLPPRSMSQ